MTEQLPERIWIDEVQATSKHGDSIYYDTPATPDPVEYVRTSEHQWIPVAEVTEPGWYWFKVFTENAPVVVMVWDDGDQLVCEGSNLDNPHSTFSTGLFSGPLAPPIQDRDND